MSRLKSNLAIDVSINEIVSRQNGAIDTATSKFSSSSKREFVDEKIANVIWTERMGGKMCDQGDRSP